MKGLTPRRGLFILLLAGIALRGGLWAAYEPVVYPDTASYLRLASNLVHADFSTYDGRRPPGYPAVLAGVAGNPRAVWGLQMIAGLGISALLFWVALFATGNATWATAMGMSYNVNLAQLFFEANLLAETIGTLLVVAVVAGLMTLERRGKRGAAPWRLVAIGALAGAAVLTKPQFVFLPLLVGALVGVAGIGRRPRLLLTRVALVTLPGLLMIFAWCAFNHAQVGYFTLSTQTGIGLMNQSLAFIELAPDRYATIRDIYVKYRDAKVARTGRHNVNWDAIPELQTATGLSLPALSQELASLSVNLFVHHPVRYAVGVTRAWIDFWLVPSYWRLDRLHPAWLAIPVALVWRVEHPLVRLVNAAFVLACILAVISRRFRERIGCDALLVSIGTIVLVTSIVQALGEYGENARYAVSVQPLIIIAVAVAARRWFEAADARVTAYQRVTG